jgi:integrase
MAKKKNETKGVYQRGKNFFIRYTVAGKQIKEKVGTDEMLAKRLLRVRLGQIECDNIPAELTAVKKYSMSDLCDKYDTYCQNQKSYKKDKKYKIAGIKERFGSLPANKMTPNIVEAWRVEMIAGTKDKKAVDPVTTNRWVAVLKNMLTLGLKWKYISGKTLYEMRSDIEMFADNDNRERYLTEEECTRLLNACSPRILPMVVIGLHTGLRRGSVLGMTWNKVDFNSGIITIPILNSKTAKTMHVRMSDGVRSILEHLPRYGEFCFSWKNGKPFADFRGEFKKVLKIANIEDFHLHDLRHTFASLNVMAGEDLYKVSKYLAHSTIAMTQRYAHLSPAYMKSATDTMNRIAPVPGHTNISLPVAASM